MRRTPARRSSVTSTVEEGWEEVACTRRRSVSNAADTVLRGFGTLTSLMEGSDSDGDDGTRAWREGRGRWVCGQLQLPRASDGRHGGLHPPHRRRGGLAAHGGLTAAPSHR
jgi:hypothetical protein